MDEEQVKAMANDEANRLIKQIIYLRKKQGLTQEKLAEKSGISRNTVVQIERGNVKISLVTFCALLEGLQIAYLDFFSSIEGEREFNTSESKEIIDLIKQLDTHPNRIEYLSMLKTLLSIK